jgi:hypothetical protein
MFQKIFDRFGNDPFSFDTQAELYTLTRPVRKGGVINYRGLNYTCQSDTQAGSKVLLVKDGLLAIPETLEPINNLRERIVLDRRVNTAPRVTTPNNPWLWGINIDLESVKYPNGSVRGAFFAQDSFILTSTIFLISVNSRDYISTLHFINSGSAYLGYSNFNQADTANSLNGFPTDQQFQQEASLLKSNSSAYYFSGRLRSAGLDDWPGLIFPYNNLRNILESVDSSYFNSGFTAYIDKPDQVSFAVEYLSFNTLTQFDPVDLNVPLWPTKSEYQFRVYLNPSTFELGSHNSTHFWHFKPNIYTTSATQNIIDRDIVRSTVNESNFVLPVLDDSEGRRAITYEISNYDLSIFEQQFFGTPIEDACTKYSIGGSAKAYYKKGTQSVEVNSHQPYFLPIVRDKATELKSSYAPGDIIEISYPEKRVGIGFLSDTGHYKSPPDTDTDNQGFLIKCDPVDTEVPRFEEVEVGISYDYEYVADLDKWTVTFPNGDVLDLNSQTPTGNLTEGSITLTVPLGAVITFSLVDEGTFLTSPGIIYFDSDGLTPTFTGETSRHTKFFSTHRVLVDGIDNGFLVSVTTAGIVRRFLLNSAGPAQFGWDINYTASNFIPVVISRTLIPLPEWGDADPDDPGNGGFLPTIPDNTARTGEVEKFNQLITTPANCWGYLPTTESFNGFTNLVQGVRGRITSITLDSTDLGYLGNIYSEQSTPSDLQAVPLAKMKFVRSFTFEVDKVLTDRFINLSVLNKQYHYLSDEENSPNGYLVLGDGFGICRDSMYETPEFGVRSGSILANKVLKTTDHRSRYVWRKGSDRKDYLYKYYPSNEVIGSDPGMQTKDYIEQFEFVYDSVNNIYNLRFVDFIEMDFTYRLVYPKDLFFKPENRI